MIRTHFDNDPSGTVSYAAYKDGPDVLLYINTALLGQVDPDFRQFLANQVLTALDETPADTGAQIIDFTEARLAKVEQRRVSSLAGVGVLAAGLDLSGLAPLFPI